MQHPPPEWGPDHSESQVELSTRYEEATAVVSVVGELDVATAPIFRQYLLGPDLWLGQPSNQAAESSGPDTAAPTVEIEALVVDLDGLDFMDSTGLSVLIEARKAVTGRSARLVLRNPQPSVRRLLQVTGLTDHFDVEE